MPTRPAKNKRRCSDSLAKADSPQRGEKVFGGRSVSSWDDCLRIGVGWVLGQEVGGIQIGHMFLEILAEAEGEIFFDLAGAFAGDAKEVADLLEGEGFIGGESFDPDDAFAVFETFGEVVHKAANALMEFVFDDAFVDAFFIGCHHVGDTAFLVITEGSIERDIGASEALFHLVDFFDTDIQAFGEQGRFGLKAHGFESVFFFAEIEEEFALGLGGPDFDHAGVVDEVFKDVGADPPLGVGGKADAFEGVELFDGLHQADVSFLDQVEQVGDGALVFHGDLDDEAEVGGGKAESQGGVACFAELDGEVVLVFFGEERIFADLTEVFLKEIELIGEVFFFVDFDGQGRSHRREIVVVIGVDQCAEVLAFEQGVVALIRHLDGMFFFGVLFFGMFRDLFGRCGGMFVFLFAGFGSLIHSNAPCSNPDTPRKKHFVERNPQRRARDEGFV